MYLFFSPIRVSIIGLFHAGLLIFLAALIANRTTGVLLTHLQDEIAP